MDPVAAVDIGATSGRVVVATLRAGIPHLTEVVRFPNEPRLVRGRWCWDVDELLEAIRPGLRGARAMGASSFGIDTWAVDYGVLRQGVIEGPVYAYRDPHHAAGIAAFHGRMSWERLYDITGIQQLPFNTVYQIAADRPQRLADGATLLLVPDLLGYCLTGVIATDTTNASTTALLDVRTREWSPEVVGVLGIPSAAFVAPDEPGVVRGHARDTALDRMTLVGVATHDTASAFAGTPISDRDGALVVSLGTWALVGAETAHHLPDERARTLNLTHELGVDGTVRVLRNAAGMWLLEECRRVWAIEDGRPPPVEKLLEAAIDAPAFTAVFDVDAPHLAAPGQSPDTIGRALRGSWDGSRGSIVRAILESVVVRIAQRLREVEAALGTRRDVIHVVGGGSRIDVMMQWLADATGKAVIAGPAEATAIGNALVQWRAAGVITGMDEARARVAAMPEVRTFESSGSRDRWSALAARMEA